MIKQIRILTFAVTALVITLGAGVSMAQLNGEYYIPQGDHPEGFASLGEAVAELNENGASGAVTFFIAGDLDETENTILINRQDLTEATSLLIKPAAGTTPTITVTHGEGGDRTSNTGFSIERAHWVTIDGSNEEDGDSRDLTIVYDDPSPVGSSSIMTVYSTVDHILVKNTILTHTHGEMGRGVLITRSAGQDSLVQNVTFQNVSIGQADQVATTAVFYEGVFGTGLDPDQAQLMDDMTIVDSDIYGTRWCIYVQSASNFNFNGNRCVINGYSAESTQSQRAGIQIQLGLGGDISGNSIIFGDINYQTDAVGVGGIFLNRNHGPLLISNNYINMTGIENSGSGTDYVIGGIVPHVGGTGDLDPEYQIYHNTIIIDSPDEEVGKHIGIGKLNQTLSGRFDIRNNIIINRKDAENSYGIENPLSAEANEDASFESDYNNIFVTGDASVGFWDDEAQADLAAWQSASGQDANSVSKDVEFESADSPRLAGDSAEDDDLLGTGVGVAFDFFGNDRDSDNPFMGASEGASPVSIERIDGESPQVFTLNQNYPNPFNPATLISYELETGAAVTLEVYAVTGQLVQTLVNNRQQSSGTYQVNFDASGLASGMYIYRLRAGDLVQTKTMMLVK